jgi:RNA polymerase sigma-70 factor (ECF subfamily)
LLEWTPTAAMSTAALAPISAALVAPAGRCTADPAAAPAEPLADAELMRRSASGDAAAFALLVERHKDPLVGYLARLVRDHARAEDVAQEAFVRLYRAAARYREQDRLLPYLYRIATNLVRSEERRRRRWRLLQPLLAGGSGPVGDPEPGPQARALASELQRQVAGALASLPIEFRVPLVLHELEEWPCAAIAELLGCRESTVKTRLHRGRRRLRAALAPYLSGGSP